MLKAPSHSEGLRQGDTWNRSHFQSVRMSVTFQPVGLTAEFDSVVTLLYGK
jgi:hypothetical protein